MGMIDEQKDSREGLAERALSLSIAPKVSRSICEFGQSGVVGRRRIIWLKPMVRWLETLQNFIVQKPQTPIDQMRQVKEELSRHLSTHDGQPEGAKLLRFP